MKKIKHWLRQERRKINLKISNLYTDVRKHSIKEMTERHDENWNVITNDDIIKLMKSCY